MSDQSNETEARAYAALNKLTKWKSMLARWQLGTRPPTDPEWNAVRDQRELLLIMRAEINTVAYLLMTKGVFTETEWADALTNEARMLDELLEKRFPGVRTTDTGLNIFDFKLFAETTKGFPP